MNDHTTGTNASPRLIGARYSPHRRRWTDPTAGVSVFSATDTWLDQPVTVAVVQPAGSDAAGRFRDRARAWSRLYQPGLMELRDLVTRNGAPFAVWEGAGGANLAELITAGALPPGQVERLVAEVAAALDVLDEAGIVHGSLHPGAVALDEAGQARILPWPAAPAPYGYGGETAWSAPEIVAGQAPTHLSDRWSVGAIGLSALVGEGPGPLDGEETAGLSRRLRHRAEPGLLEILTTYMAADPGSRVLEARTPAEATAPSAGRAVPWGGAGIGAAVIDAGRRLAEAAQGTGRRVPTRLVRPPHWGRSGVVAGAVAAILLSLLPGSLGAGASSCPTCGSRPMVLAPTPPRTARGAPVHASEASAVVMGPPTSLAGPAPGASSPPAAPMAGPTSAPPSEPPARPPGPATASAAPPGSHPVGGPEGSSDRAGYPPGGAGPGSSSDGTDHHGSSPAGTDQNGDLGAAAYRGDYAPASHN